ncbi:MAG: TMEM175 family protein [Betaproteobacteria bacterium]
MSESRVGAAPVQSGYSKHRIEGLSDGIYAVAMTLLALELKLPEHARIADSQELVGQLAHLLPQFASWALSFAILGIFWFVHQRVFSRVRVVDTRLLVINLASLGFITLHPFCSMLIGSYPGLFAAHVAYASNMAMISLLSIMQLNHIWSKPELTDGSLTLPLVRAARFRSWSLLVCAGLSVVVAWFAPPYSSMAFMAMIVFSRISRRLEQNSAAAAVPAPVSSSASLKTGS